MLAYLPLWVTMANGYSVQLTQCNGDQLGECVWEYTATWGTDPNKNNQQPTMTFDTGGGSVKITQSIQTVNSYSADGSTPPDFNGAIGVTDDGTVEGVELPGPIFRWNEKHFLPQAVAGAAAWQQGITNLCQHTNAAPFRGYDVAQVKFDHITGQDSGTDPVEVTFYFEAQQNLTNLTVGSITGITKNAWDYLWVRYQNMVIGGSQHTGLTAPRPKDA